MSPKQNPYFPLAYHITFHCYGCWFHGTDPESVDPRNNQPDSPFLPPNKELRDFEKKEMVQPPYYLDEPRRKAVLKAIKEVCLYRGWLLHAVHVRYEHVHIVVQASVKPEKVMNDFKAYASRQLTREGIDDKTRKRWSRHGSTKYMWTCKEVEDVVNYVVRKQGEPMDVYEMGMNAI